LVHLAIAETVADKHRQAARRPASAAKAVAGKLVAVLEIAGEGVNSDGVHAPE
jgi:hypothetical protein